MIAADYFYRLTPDLDEDPTENIEMTLSPSLAIEKIEKPWIMIKKLVRDAMDAYSTALNEFKCFGREESKLSKDGCRRLGILHVKFNLDTRWSKKNRLSVIGLFKDTVYLNLTTNEPAPDAKKRILRATKRQLLPLLRTHLKNFLNLLKFRSKEIRLRIARGTKPLKLRQQAALRVSQAVLHPWRPLVFDDGFWSVIIRPKAAPAVNNATQFKLGGRYGLGNALSAEFPLERIGIFPPLTPRALYVAQAFPMDSNGLLLPGAPPPRIGICLSTRPLFGLLNCGSKLAACKAVKLVPKDFNSRTLLDCDLVDRVCNPHRDDLIDIINRKRIKLTFAWGIGAPLRGKPIGIQ